MAAKVTPQFLRSRVHVGARDWQESPATDYWFYTGPDVSVASGATNISGLDSFGWTTTSLAFTNLVTGDFMAAADDTPIHLLTNADLDVLQSPIMFGSYAHQQFVKSILGYEPTRLCAEFYAAFTVATADETASHIGFYNGAAVVMAINSDGTLFELYNGSTKDNGAAVDNAYHLWKIAVDKGAGTAEWFIDGTSQGTLAITQDVWPAAFRMAASTTNRPALSWAHVWYE